MAISLHGVDEDRRAPLTKAASEAAVAVQRHLGARLPATLAIEFVGSDDDFAAVMGRYGVSGWDERWLAGLALLDQDRIIVHVNGTRALGTRETLEHELVHVLMHRTKGAFAQPRWYQEGAAMLLTGEATWERMKSMAGAAPLGQLDSLGDLDDGLLGSAVEKERAYATAAAFLQFSTRRAGDRNAVAELQRQMQAGLGFDQAFALSFGRSPDDLYRIFAEHMKATASAWSLLLTDEFLWTLLSVLSAIALVHAWRQRAKYDDMPTDSPGRRIDLEAVAAAGEAALRRPWQRRDFGANPLIVESYADDDAEVAPAASEGMAPQADLQNSLTNPAPAADDHRDGPDPESRDRRAPAAVDAPHGPDL